MRLLIANCEVDYSGRISTRLPTAWRLIMVKGDGSVLIHSDGGSYKPLNWMAGPCYVETDTETDAEHGEYEVWRVSSPKIADMLVIRLYEVAHDHTHVLGEDPGLEKDGVEAHLQVLLAEQTHRIEPGCTLVRREYPTAIGPVDILARDAQGGAIAVEIKRRGEIDGVEQLTRYLELLNRDATLAPVRGVFAAQEIKPQARTLAEDRGITCLVLDYEAMKGEDHAEDRLF